jgi:protein translocase SecG subunit
MTFLASSLPIIQIVLVVLITIGVLLQQSDTGLGDAFGGGDSGTSFHTRRGAEQFLFMGTIVFSILFVASCFVALVI